MQRIFILLNLTEDSKNVEEFPSKTREDKLNIALTAQPTSLIKLTVVI
jgi:hypothetical protein